MKTNLQEEAFIDKSKETLLLYRGSEVYDDGESHCMCFASLRDAVKRFWTNLREFALKALDMGRQDPRKIIFAIKSGLALSFISLLIFWKQPFADIAQYSIWAILTVIVMFEFSIGATFIKGFNRGLGTLCAAILAFCCAQLSMLAGRWEQVIIVISIFIVASAASYLRLYPTMAPYDYGYRVFVLTYCILMMAGNRTREYTQAILTRLLLIAVGAGVCFIVNTCVFPIWAGEDLHRLVVKNFKDLATSLEGCVSGYLKCVEYVRIPSKILTYQSADDPLYSGYRSVIESSTREKTLLGFAVWEPPHGRYRLLNYPWEYFVQVSGALRHCAFMVMALHGCILSEIQAPPEKRQVFGVQLHKVGIEGAKVLVELGNKIEKMEKLGTNNILKDVHEAAEKLQKEIDQRSYLLVNSDSWGIGKPPVEQSDLEILGNEKDQDGVQLDFKSVSETQIDLRSFMASTDRLHISDLPINMFKDQMRWPSRLSLDGDVVINEDEVRTYESASSLSLATFASLLIELVARLQNIVDAFEELSNKAEFKEPDISKLPTQKSVSLWTRLSRCFGFKS